MMAAAKPSPFRLRSTVANGTIGGAAAVIIVELIAQFTAWSPTAAAAAAIAVLCGAVAGYLAPSEGSPE